MNLLETAAWALLSALCLHQMKIVDIPKTVQRLAPQMSIDGSNTTATPRQDSEPTGGAEPTSPRTEAGEQAIEGIQRR